MPLAFAIVSMRFSSKKKIELLNLIDLIPVVQVLYKSVADERH